MVATDGTDWFVALRLSLPLHLFGHGKATFRPVFTPPFEDWGIGPKHRAYCICSAASYGTLDGLSIEAPCGTIKVHSTHGVGIEGGKLRLQ